ncbi:migration and invasion-inhibitory protein isoform X3 [Rhinoderma darwinii]|uniref:migration and invasion-inhibitory protein isoform X3 n=1 Tax=Rhinoderma darwinii TaxID=43563 RepID=UPI003F6680DB
MSSSDQLEELRRLNKSLLEKLNLNRDEHKKQLFTDSSVRIMATDEPCKTWKPKTGRDGSEAVRRCPLRSQDPALQTTQGSSATARKALCTPRKTQPRETRPHVMSRGSEHGVHSAQDVIKTRSPVKRVAIMNSTMINPKSATSGSPSDFPPQYIEQLEDDGNLRTKEARTPKSILLTPNRGSKRDTGRVTFLCDDESPRLEGWSARPLLGYDWIAVLTLSSPGLLEVKSPITNKSDQFFSEINEFRRVNREECAHEFFTEVSIPRSTLLPPYKYRAHRRKSFDPTDSLALPSHCLAGYDNAVPSCDLKVACLDLKTSMEPNLVPPPTTVNVGTDCASYFASRATSDNLLNLSRSIAFRHSNIK